MTSEKKRQSSDRQKLREQQTVHMEKDLEERNYLLNDSQTVDEEEDDYW